MHRPLILEQVVASTTAQARWRDFLVEQSAVTVEEQIVDSCKSGSRSPLSHVGEAEWAVPPGQVS